jgi:hypothetical protein
VAASAVSVATSAAPGGGTGDCPSTQLTGFQKLTVEGFEAQHFCGPATATITLGGASVQIASGSCTTLGTVFFVSIGTELFGSPAPAQEPDLLIVNVDSTSGTGSVSGVAGHKHWLLNSHPVAFGPGGHSGTFSGVTLVPGTSVNGSFIC